ncbi:MAG: hypothetical protein WBV06_05610 [Acidimicrobiia bacterium]
MSSEGSAIARVSVLVDAAFLWPAVDTAALRATVAAVEATDG